MRELEGRVALVTGGARNIGRAIALDLAEGGAHVMLAARADREGLEETAKLARGKGVRAEIVTADLTDPAAVRGMIEAVQKTFGRLDVLVNNAALRGETKIADITIEEWRKVLAVNLDAAFLATQAALPLLQASDAGAVINIGGLTAYTGAKNRPHVVAAKAGLDGLTKALAQDLAPVVTVNLVSPGLIETIRGGSSPIEPDHHKKHTTLMGRRGRPEEVASMVRHLAGPNGRYITGQTIHVNGGVYLP